MIKHVVFDVDGVFTDGGFYYSADGKVMKKFGPHDADGVKSLKRSGITVECITADERGYPITLARCEDMGLKVTLVSEDSRFSWIQSLDAKASTAFVGDGHYDAQCFELVGFSAAPANAVSVAKERCVYLSNCSGGHGAVYDICMEILKLNEKPY